MGTSAEWRSPMKALHLATLILSLVSVKGLPQLDEESRNFGFINAEVRDTTLYPLVLNPLNINKLTCGSLINLIDNSNEDITVSADACLIGLLFGSLGVLPILFGPEDSPSYRNGPEESSTFLG